MAGNDLHAEALTIALRHAPPEIGVSVICQLVTVKPKPQNGRGAAPPGQIPAWHLIMTMSDPVNLVGNKLRHIAFIGDGAPDLAVLPSEVERGLTELRTLARSRLAANS